MKKISRNNLIKLYIDEANNGQENKLLIFQVNDMLEAAKVYQAISIKVKKIRVAYFQNSLINGISTKMTKSDADRLYMKYLELKRANCI